MEGVSDNISVRNSETTTESESLCSVMDEIFKRKTDYSQKTKDFDSLSSSISMQYKKLLDNKDTAETNDSCSKYMSAPKRIQNEHEQFNAASMKYYMEEIKMRREIRELETKLKSGLSRNQITSQEISNLQKKKTATQEALCLAKKYYSSVWDMHIHIEDSKEDRFTCIINFKFDCGMYPIKFIIDRCKQEIIDWNSSSLLTPDEELEMKERYSGTDYYFPKVLSELRLLALNKIKMAQ